MMIYRRSILWSSVTTKLKLLLLQARPILRDKDRLEELVDPRLADKYPKEDFIRVCTIAAACVALEASQRPTMGEVVQSLKMVQRLAEYQDTMPNPSARPNIRQSSTTYESDGTSSMFSSGPFSGLSLFDNDNISRTAVFSEDLHEGRWQFQKLSACSSTRFCDVDACTFLIYTKCSMHSIFMKTSSSLVDCKE